MDGEGKGSLVQVLRKKVGGMRVSGEGGDVESLDDVIGEEGEAADSEWTLGAGDASEEVYIFIPGLLLPSLSALRNWELYSVL